MDAEAGASATLSVATDQARSSTSRNLEASAYLSNSSTSLEGGALHLEIVTPCSAIGGGDASYHISTWDGAKWVERPIRHRGPVLHDRGHGAG